MPRPPKDYSKPVPYTPQPPPVVGSSNEEVIRATWDEFNRIAALLAQMPMPAKDSQEPHP